ncbi:MAG: nucleotidyltransferase domain-containing protein [Planctomycetota bacterium]|jgi:hypothetical protein
MRLSKGIKEKIVKYSQKHFGTKCRLFLFGSRVDDNKKGGDIDLFLDSPVDIDRQAQISFLKDIFINVTQRKVDLVVKTPAKKNTAIFENAGNEGVLLC